MTTIKEFEIWADKKAIENNNGLEVLGETLTEDQYCELLAFSRRFNGWNETTKNFKLNIICNIKESI